MRTRDTIILCLMRYYSITYRNTITAKKIKTYMRKLLILLTFFMFSATSMLAQSMTDDQIIEYVKTENKAGKSQQQIAQELVSKGVTRAQLERIRDKYQKEQAEAAKENGSDNGSKSKSSSTRENNGEEVDEELFMDSLEIEEKKIFGHDIFRNKDLSFEPNMNISTPVNYVLGPGDEVIIDIYGASQSNKTYKVTPEGNIIVPNIGPIAVSGLSVLQAQAKVADKIGVHYQNSSIKLSVGQTRTIIVNVLGEVLNPGTYTISAFASVFNALYLAGGITEIGTLRNIKVSRNGRIITTVDVYDYIVNGKLTGNVLLRDNDVIIVGAYDNLVQIEGKVKRPMYYEMKKNESLQSLLTFAGGFTGDAYKKKIRIERKGDEGYAVHTVDEWDFNSFALEDEDLVTIDEIVKRYQNMVEVTGAVFYPGKYTFNNNCNSVKALVEHAGGLTEDAFTGRGTIYRMKEDRTRKTMSVDLNGIMDGTSPDVILANEDSLVIGSRENEILARTVMISGSVVNPGKYSYSEGEKVEDLILRAGGLLEDASYSNIEVSHMNNQKGGEEIDYNTLSTVFTMTLKDGLAVEGQSDYELQPFDVVVVHPSPSYHNAEGVGLWGEVMYTGLYILTQKNERISSLIKRAGGLTEGAYVQGARLTRPLTAEERAIQEIVQSTYERDSLNNGDIEIKDTYSVGVDLAKAIENPGSTWDIVMRPGDQIVIPKQNNTVRVLGSVLFPNTITWTKGKKLSYYINQAGGYMRTSDKGQAYIVYANGQVSKGTKGKIEPGCQIVVPEKQKKQNNSAQNTTMAVSLASAAATIGAVMITAFK